MYPIKLEIPIERIVKSYELSKHLSDCIDHPSVFSDISQGSEYHCNVFGTHAIYGEWSSETRSEPVWGS
jgi:hypothetical protein